VRDLALAASDERLRVRGNVALNDAVAHRVLQDRTHGPDDLVDL
jgi:hypothetical protein